MTANVFVAAFDGAHQWLFESLVQPALFALGMSNVIEDGFIATALLLVGLLQLLVMVVVFGTLERWRPVEAVTDRAAVRDDIVYTLIHRLGIFRVGVFLALDPLFDELGNTLRLGGWNTWHLDGLWPGVTDKPWIAFVIYLLLFDLVDYWIHRGQHRVHAWWQLHALHHSQRQMTYWSDNRNHLLDDTLRDVLLVMVALAIGVPPAQFIAVVAVTQLVESLSHVNARVNFGSWLSRMIVSPRYHRRHHAIGEEHDVPSAGVHRGHNFAVLFPVWDVLFGTADFKCRPSPTGLQDQLPEGGARNYGRGFWQQQWLGVRRLVGRG